MVKKALITGATGKIGREVCLELARVGYDIALHYHRSEDAAHKLADEILFGCLVKGGTARIGVKGKNLLFNFN